MDSLPALPTEILHYIFYTLNMSALDILHTVLTCKTLHHALLGPISNPNPYDVDQHRAKCGLSFCTLRGWIRPALFALSRGYGDDAPARNAALVWGAENNAVELVKALLGDRRRVVNVRTRRCLPLVKAAGRGNVEIVKALMMDDDFNIWMRSGDEGWDEDTADELDEECLDAAFRALEEAATFGRLEVVKTMFAVDRDLAHYVGCLPDFLTDLFHRAVANGRNELVTYFIMCDCIDPADYNNQAVMIAAEYGIEDTLQLLLEDPRVDPADRNNEAIHLAVASGCDTTVAVLLADPRVDPTANNNAALIEAITSVYGTKEKMIPLLLDHPAFDGNAHAHALAFVTAAYVDDRFAEIILAHPKVDPSTLLASVLDGACGHTTHPISLLLANPNVDPSVANNGALTWAVAEYKGDLVSQLLGDPRVDPTDGGRYGPLLMAAAQAWVPNNSALFNALMADSRVVITDSSNDPPTSADVVRHILALPDADPTINNNRALKIACRGGNKEVFRLLMEDPRVNATIPGNALLMQAAVNDRKEFVATLLAHPDVDPAFGNNKALIEAARYGCIDAVRLLLADPRVDPGDQNNLAIQLAAEEGHLEVISALLEHPGVDPAVDDNAPIDRAIASPYGDTDAVLALFHADPRVGLIDPPNV